MPRLDYQRQCAELESEAANFAAAVHDADPAAAVPTCPEWTLDQLTAHTCRGIRWAATMIERRTTTPIRPVEIDADLPADPDERTTAIRADAARLVAAIHDSGPDTEIWSWADDRTAGFWLGRMLHETLVHRIDAELATGHDPAGIAVAPDLAADGVADMMMVARNLSARAQRAFAGLTGTGQTLLFQATDTDTTWLARRTPSGVEWTWDAGPADVTVRGTARDLMLVLTRRTPADDRLAVDGDAGLLGHWLANSTF